MAGYPVGRISGKTAIRSIPSTNILCFLCTELTVTHTRTQICPNTNKHTHTRIQSNKHTVKALSRCIVQVLYENDLKLTHGLVQT